MTEPRPLAELTDAELRERITRAESFTTAHHGSHRCEFDRRTTTALRIELIRRRAARAAAR